MLQRVRLKRTYPVFTGFIVGCLVTGLLVPLLFARHAVPLGTATSGQVSSGPAGGGATPGGTAAQDAAGGGVSGSASSGSRTTSGALAGTTGTGSAGGPGTGQSVRTGGPVSSGPPIVVGAVVQDVGGVGKAGFGAAAGLSPQQQQSAYDAYFNWINTHGGINGRKIEGTYYTVDITNTDTYRAACLNFTQDKHVFAVLSGPGFAGGTQCVSIEQHTPEIIADTSGIPSEWVAQANGMLATVFAASQRQMSMFTAQLDSLGLLAHRTIGILADQTDAGNLVLNSALLPALKARGYSAKYIAKLSADTGTAASQVPVEVQQMRGAGVNTVLAVTNTLYAEEFAQSADNQGYRPKYLVPDWGAASDAGDANMPSSWDGTLISALTTYDYNAGKGDSPADARCRQIYESATHDKLTRSDSGSALRMDFTLFECDLVDIFARAALAAGPNLTRTSFSAALQGLGAFTTAALGPGSFEPGKLQYSDAVRSNVWTAGCKCWKPTASF